MNERNRLGLNPGEGAVTAASTVYFFLIILVYYVLKPLRESLALELGSENVPALNIISMCSLVLANGLYSWIVSRFRREKFIPAITRACSISLVLFWLVFRDLGFPENRIDSFLSPRALAIAGYFLWVNLFGLFMVSMFWSFINDVFSVEQGKRLYTLIGYGGLVGGVSGGVITTQLVQFIGTAHLFLVVAIILEPTVHLMHYIHNSRGKGAFPNSSPPLPVTPQSATPNIQQELSYSLGGFRLTFSSFFLGLMALEMFLYTFGSTIFSYQVNALMEAGIPSRAERTIYWAHMYNLINGTSLLTQFALTRMILGCRAPWVGLLMMPIVQLVGSIGLIQVPTLQVAAGTGVGRYALNYSTGRAVRELFFTPLTREEKYQAKGFIDTLVFRVGDGLASMFLVLGLKIWGKGLWIDSTVILTMIVSLVVVFLMGREFNRRQQLSQPS